MFIVVYPTNDPLCASTIDLFPLNANPTSFVSGQIVTVGNGIVDIGIGTSAKFILTGLSRHLFQTSCIDPLQNHNDRPMATIHQQRSVR